MAWHPVYIETIEFFYKTWVALHDLILDINYFLCMKWIRGFQLILNLKGLNQCASLDEFQKKAQSVRHTRLVDDIYLFYKSTYKNIFYKGDAGVVKTICTPLPII